MQKEYTVHPKEEKQNHGDIPQAKDNLQCGIKMQKQCTILHSITRDF
jgi:hypothetical protein